ncbi:MAG: M16 family metallopeptidase, partial [Caulobacteraceae bacterium]
PNGMRYAIMRNDTPPGQVSMRLRFAVGSLMETKEEQGLAHFLEHMAFNGSTNVPTRGEMAEDLERLGLAFGADTNAGTGFDQTVYKFDLPKSDPRSVDTALMLLREIASNLTLSQTSMDEERGVILSEERLRDSPSYRVLKALYGFTMAGQRPPERFPIGLTSVIENAKRDLLADIYHEYYRPERATLVIVGDIDPAAMEAKIKARFGDWKGDGPAGADPDLGTVAPRGADFKVAVVPGASTTLDLSWVSPPDLAPDTFAKRRRQTLDELGFAVLNRRLGDLARGANPPFISAAAVRGDALHAEEVTRVIVNAQPDKWKEALASAETEVRRAVRYGVRPDELTREIADIRASLATAADEAPTRRTPSMADEIVGTLSDDLVETSPAEDLALFDKVTKGLKPEEVSDVLKKDFSGDGPLVFLATPTPVEGDVAAVKKTFELAEAAPVTPPEAARVVGWPYASFGAPGKVVERRDVADLDTVFVRFANGVRLTVKPTKFTRDQVLVRVRFGEGLEGMSPDRQSIAWAGGAFAEGGLRQISAEDRERALAGRVYGVEFAAEPSAFVLAGATRTDDLPTQLQVLAAYVSDPGWRPEAMERWKTAYAAYEDQLKATDSSLLGRDLSGLLHSGDRRWTFPTPGDVRQASPAELKAMLAPALASGPVDVVVVGDIAVDKAIEETAETFGALPPRPDPAPPKTPAHDPRFPTASPAPVVETHDGRPDQGIALVAWPTNDFFANPAEARVDTILADVLRLRLIDRMRLKEGVTYSPSAYARASEVFPHYGFILAEMEAPPPKLAGFFTGVEAIAADLRDKPVGPDELERAKKPAIDTLEKAEATNAYWLAGLSGAQTDPRKLAALRSAEAQLERVSAADVQRAAQQYLVATKAWKLEIRPKDARVASAADTVPTRP